VKNVNFEQMFVFLFIRNNTKPNQAKYLAQKKIKTSKDVGSGISIILNSCEPTVIGTVDSGNNMMDSRWIQILDSCSLQFSSALNSSTQLTTPQLTTPTKLSSVTLTFDHTKIEFSRAPISSKK
jgi:hypothetical protein